LGLGDCRQLITIFTHDGAMKYMTALLMAGILKILNLSEKLPLYLVDCICHLLLPATNQSISQSVNFLYLA